MNEFFFQLMNEFEVVCGWVVVRVFDFWNFFQINFKHYTKGALDPIDIKCERIFQNGPSKLNLFKF